MPRKVFWSMAGLNHLWCLRDRRITKIEIPSNPVFIGVSSHPFDVAFYNEGCYLKRKQW